MKKKTVGLLLAVLMCIGMFTGCLGIGSLGLPDNSAYTYRDYAVLNQELEDGSFDTSLYALYEFPGDMSQDEIRAKLQGEGDILIHWFYQWTSGQESMSYGYGKLDKWHFGELDEETGKREIILVGKIYETNEDGIKNYQVSPFPMKAGDRFNMKFEMIKNMGQFASTNNGKAESVIIAEDHIFNKDIYGQNMNYGQNVDGALTEILL